MSEQLIVVPENGESIIKGQPFSVVVTVSDDKTIGDNTEINVTNLIGVKLLKIFPRENGTNNFSQEIIFFAEKSSSEYNISFFTNTASNLKIDVEYKAVDNLDFKPETCVLGISSSYLYDPNPVDFSGTIPRKNNPFILASVNPIIKGGDPISDYDIWLRTTAPLRIFTLDMTEISPYKVDQEKKHYDYLVHKVSEDAVNLKIYATKGISDIIGLEIRLNDSVYNQKLPLFINTAPINTSSLFRPPTIRETDTSSTLTKPDQAENFHFMVPNDQAIKIDDVIIGFVTDDQKNPYKKPLCFGKISGLDSLYSVFSAYYDNLYIGDNFISYVILNRKNKTIGSRLNYINYVNGGNNSPNPNDENRTLVVPKVYDQYGNYISIHNPVNINSIGEKGLEVRLPSEPGNLNHTIAPNDIITVKAYISYCDDTYSPPRPLPIVVIEDHLVKQEEIKDGYYKVVIPAGKLMGYNISNDADVGSITIDYSRIVQNQKSKFFTRAFDTVAP